MEELFSNNKSSIVTSNRILYTPSSFARTSLLHLQEIRELEAKRRHMSSRSNLASFLFFTVVSGAGRLEYCGKEYKLGVGDMVFIDCHKLYSHTTVQTTSGPFAGPTSTDRQWGAYTTSSVNGVEDRFSRRRILPRFLIFSASSFLRKW